MKGQRGSAIFAMDNAFLNISHTDFINNNVETKGIITLSESHLIMQSCILDKSFGSAIAGDVVKNIELT